MKKLNFVTKKKTADVQTKHSEFKKKNSPYMCGKLTMKFTVPAFEQFYFWIVGTTTKMKAVTNNQK